MVFCCAAAYASSSFAISLVASASCSDAIFEAKSLETTSFCCSVNPAQTSPILSATNSVCDLLYPFCAASAAAAAFETSIPSFFISLSYSLSASLTPPVSLMASIIALYWAFQSAMAVLGLTALPPLSPPAGPLTVSRYFLYASSAAASALMVDAMSASIFGPTPNRSIFNPPFSD